LKEAQKPDHVSLNSLVGRLKDGRFAIPDFQREFEWQPWDIRDLVRSIFLDYYIGSLLLWKSKQENFDALACEPIYGFSGDSQPEHIVLDGQQRLTAMYYAFVAPKAPIPGRRNRYLYHVRVDRFMEEAYEDAFQYEWTQSSVVMLSNRSAQFRGHIFPLSVIGSGGWDLAKWVMDYEGHWIGEAETAASNGDAKGEAAARQHAVNAGAFGEHLKGISELYQVAYIELDRDLALDRVCEIFTQVNSKGVRLDVFDLMNALLKPKGLQLKHLWRQAAPKLAFIETDRLNIYMLQVMSILRQAYCSPKYLYYLLPGASRPIRQADGSRHREVLVADAAAFRELWDRSLKALTKAIAVLRDPREYGAISSAYLPYEAILPVFAALQDHAGTVAPEMRLGAQKKMHLWYWSSVFTNRYSGSVESTAARDFMDVQAWMDESAEAPGLLEEFRTRFRTLDLRREVRKGSSVYNGIFNLFVMEGARDWITGQRPRYDDLDDHHIVPKDWGKAQTHLGGGIDTILNRTPLSADTNRNVIRNRLPNVYLPELIAKNGEPTMRAILASHFVSSTAFDILLRKPFSVDDYEAFLDERRTTIIQAIQDLLSDEQLDLAAPLRALDEGVERIELGLRQMILTVLGGAASKLPSAVREKATERWEASLRMNPTADPPRTPGLADLLEYCDLRELQDTITNKLLWPEFSRFGQKEALAARFGQLAELRNAIRHSRKIDAVRRKDGEAAILWFQQSMRDRT
jgi:hypothetical protein